LNAKQLELLRELLPQVTTIGFIVDTTVVVGTAAVSDLQAAARAMGIPVIVVNANGEREIDAAFAALVQRQVGAIMASGAAAFTSRRHQIVALAAQHRLPAVYQTREFVAAGGLMSYGSNIPDAYRQGGIYAGRILDGASPADLPVVLSTRVELVINVRTAVSIGLAIPPALLARADQVIE
jgi:putative ABC transport system substrate-binding protein